jgi:hypothetical protein
VLEVAAALPAEAWARQTIDIIGFS